MRQTKASKQNKVPRSFSEVGTVVSKISTKKKSAKLKPAEFGMLMAEMAAAPTKKTVAKKRKVPRMKMLSVSKPNRKEAGQIAALAQDMSRSAKKMQVVCTPWYAALMGRRTSFMVGLWLGIVSMGLLSLLAWRVISHQTFLSFVTLPDTSSASPSNIAQ